MNDSEYKSPYKGILIGLFFIIGAPILCYWFIYTLLEWNDYHKEVELTARVIGSGVGVCLHLGMIIQGLLLESWTVVKNRISEFFANLTIGIGFAISQYFKDLKQSGVAFIIYFTPIAVCFAVFVNSVMDLLNIM